MVNVFLVSLVCFVSLVDFVENPGSKHRSKQVDKSGQAREKG